MLTNILFIVANTLAAILQFGIWVVRSVPFYIHFYFGSTLTIWAIICHFAGWPAIRWVWNLQWYGWGQELLMCSVIFIISICMLIVSSVFIQGTKIKIER